MIADILSTLAGLAVGVATGYYFEWRRSYATRADNAELQAQLRKLRESIYSVGRGDEATATTPYPIGERLLEWIRSYQGPDGTVSRIRLVRRFADEGVASQAVYRALSDLEARDLIVDGELIQVRS